MQLIILLLPYAASSILPVLCLYWVASLVRFLVSKPHDDRLTLPGELVIKTLRSMTMRSRQRVVLTQFRVMDTGSFRYGLPFRSSSIPINRVDSLVIGRGRNLWWLCLSITGVMILVFGETLHDAGFRFASLIFAAVFALAYWLSDERVLIIRSKTATIRVEMSLVNLDFVAKLGNEPDARMTESVFFDFCTALQTAVAGQSPVTAIATPATSLCKKCSAPNEPGARFCEACGSPL